MKNIFIVSRAKNESDIIESFCRYNLTYCDGMIINDNKSDDNTLEILYKLINEGLPIYLTDEKSQLKKAKMAIEEHGADLIIPLDADEFLYHIDGINPRETLEEMQEDIEYHAIWRTYIYKKEPDIKLGFMPNNFTHYRNSCLEQYIGNRKTIASKYLIKNKNASFVGGMHFLVYPEEYQSSAKVKIHKKLVIAHFPIRSKFQLIKKVVPNWTTKWSKKNRVPKKFLDTYQLGILFNQLKEKGEMTPEEIIKNSIEYAIVASEDNNLTKHGLNKKINNLGDKLTIHDPMNVSSCKNKLKLRYTKYNYDNKIFLRAVLKEIDKTVTFLDKESNERLAKINKIYHSLEKSGIIYFDTGNGFNDNERHIFSFKGNEVEVTCHVPDNTENIRLDTVISFGCVIYDMEILSLGGVVGYKPVNGFMDKIGNLYFENFDPQVFIDKSIGFLKIKYKILVLTEIFHYKFVNDYINIYKNIDNLKTERDSLILERNSLITERDSLILERNSLILERNSLITERDSLILERNSLIAERDIFLNSRSWRFMKPMRSFASLIRRYKILRLFAKGLLSIKRIGIIKTIKRIFYYILKKPIKNISLIENYIPIVKTKEIIQRHTEDVDIIICIHNAYEDVKHCIESIYEYTSEPYNIILVDDGSAEQTKSYLSSLNDYCQNIILIRNEQGSGYTKAANQGLKNSKAEYCVLLNSDTIVTEGWLDKMIKCQKSDKNIGLVGPLSNTASWQSVPCISDANGDWAKNELPDNISIEKISELINNNSAQLYPKVQLLNGFCLLIHRSVIKKIGYFDEENFGSGFAEEDDYNIRAGKAGYKLAIADDTYIYHAQSKSYSDEKRIALCNENGIKLRKKHGDELINNYIGIMKDNYILEGIRARVKIMAEREEIIKKAKEKWEGKRVLIILPLMDIGGGGNVVIQEARSMIEMGIDLWIYNLERHKIFFEKNYPNINIPVIYGEKIDSFLKYVNDFNIIISTLFTTVKFMDFNSEEVKTIASYYIQDYEPYFLIKNDSLYNEAIKSYTISSNIILLTKTEWNRLTVKEKTGANPIVIGKSFDINIFQPRKISINNIKIITAMVRPNTPRRGPELTIKVLNEIANKYKNKIQIFIFGSDSNESEVDKNFWNVNYINPNIINLGILKNNEMVSLLSKADIFIDFSKYQAMGLTAMEAMACGCGVIVPKKGGASEFVIDGKNGILVDTTDINACKRALYCLVDDNEFLKKISYQAISDICEYYPEKCAYNILNTCLNN